MKKYPRPKHQTEFLIGRCWWWLPHEENQHFLFCTGRERFFMSGQTWSPLTHHQAFLLPLHSWWEMTSWKHVEARSRAEPQQRLVTCILQSGQISFGGNTFVQMQIISLSCCPVIIIAASQAVHCLSAQRSKSAGFLLWVEIKTQENSARRSKLAPLKTRSQDWWGVPRIYDVASVLQEPIPTWSRNSQHSSGRKSVCRTDLFQRKYYAL